MNQKHTLPVRPLRVLLLDDDPVTLIFVSEMLHSLGIDEVIAVEDGERGLAILDASPIDLNLLICDLQMPGMDGIEFLRNVAERGYAGDIILLSGVQSGVLKAAERLTMAHGLHILGTLEKPITADDLTTVLAASRRAATAAKSPPPRNRN